jgi:autotransporter-associated beta strand protein
VATNPVGSSAVSASSCVTTPVTGTMLTWDAGSSPVGPQDGNDFWGSGAATWWNGSVNIVWTDDNLAVIGNGTATNCIVSLTNNVTPSGLIFSANNGGSYTVTNAGGNLVLSGTPTVAACNNATIGTVIQGAGALVKSGSSNLTLSGTNTYSGGTTIAEGTLTLGNAAAIGKNGSYANGFTLENGTFDVNGQANYITANLGAVGKTWLINAEAITLGGESGGVMTIQDSGGTGSGFSLYNLQNCIIYNATGNPGPATISAPWLGDGQSGAGIIKTINVGQSTNSGGVELDFTGQLGQNSGNDGANTTIQKTGAGTMRISAANYFPYVRVTAGTLIVNNAAALGTTRTQNGTANNLVTVDGGTLDLNGFSPSIGSLTNGGVTTGVILNNGASGSTLTVGAANTSTIFAGSIKDGA